MSNAYLDYDKRGRELLLTPDVRARFVRLNRALDSDGRCPGCDAVVSRYETDRLTHTMRCVPLKRDTETADIATAAGAFPSTFGLRAFPGQTFRIDARASFISEIDGLQLVVQRLAVAGDERHGLTPGHFVDFTRDTPAAIRAQLVTR